MKPMKVTAGENAPDVDELIEKANSMDEMLAKVATTVDDSQMRKITGVEEAPMNHYWTNQMQPDENIETVTKKNVAAQNVNMIDANPHQTGSTLSAHENTAGGIQKASKPDYLDMDGDGNKKESMKDAIKDKKGKSVKKGNMGAKDKYCMKNYGKKYSECSDSQKAQCDKVHGPVKKAPPMPDMGMGGGGPPGGGDMGEDPLAALLGGAGGPKGGEDLPDDPMELGKKIEQMGKKIQDILGGGMGDMGAPPPGGDDMGGEGDSMPMAPGM